ncbi:nuclear receptor coactivator 7 isoform X1 [Paramormyrops kingsleyae]|uniref:nuclear receptor coactivator 7 isoform X1 n=1 Tax=Paramormyrops kingsleyae TaxID=1676925 RepID=UPI000CD6388B|nr:nuclear receptor coactivator 7 isoform X1 [Paramormyrops kingsleyae]
MGVAYSIREVDHLYTVFVPWSLNVNGKETRRRKLISVEEDPLNLMDSLFSEPINKSWEIITVHETKQWQSVCSSEEEEPHGDDLEDLLLPELIDRSDLLGEIQCQKLANHLPARTQGNPWRLAYSTAVHGTSLRTLYRYLSSLDSPVLLVIKDMGNQVFGAFSSHPFRVSSCCYGTGETFLFSFSPDLKVFRWSGENSYFVRGHWDSLQIGAGGGCFGLWLDADLCRGSSFPCQTFNNQPLSSKKDFTVQDLEVWTFSSREI